MKHFFFIESTKYYVQDEKKKKKCQFNNNLLKINIKGKNVQYSFSVSFWVFFAFYSAVQFKCNIVNLKKENENLKKKKNYNIHFVDEKNIS